MLFKCFGYFGKKQRKKGQLTSLGLLVLKTIPVSAAK